MRILIAFISKILEHLNDQIYYIPQLEFLKRFLLLTLRKTCFVVALLFFISMSELQVRGCL